MTRELLEQYPDIVAKLEYLEARQRSKVYDTVEASSGPPAYKKHIITISGTKKVQSDSERIHELKEQLQEIDDFMGTLSFRQRRIAEMRAMKGMSWNQIAAKMGYNYGKEGVRSIYRRIFKK